MARTAKRKRSNEAQVAAVNESRQETKGSVSPPRSHRWRTGILVALLIGVCTVAGVQWGERSLRSRIHVALDAQENLEALQRVERYEAWFTASAETRRLAARAYRRLGDEAHFRRAIQQAKDLRGDLSVLQHEEVLYQVSRGALPAIGQQVDRLLQQHSDDYDETVTCILQGLLTQQDIDLAIKLLVAWETQSEDSPGVPLFHGILAIWRRDWALARSKLEPAQALHPEYVPYYLQLGVAYSGLKEDSLSRAAFERYLKSVPKDRNAQIKYVDVLTRLGEQDRALEILQSMMREGVETTDVRLQTARLLLEQGDAPGAIVLLKPLSQVWPEDVAVASLLSQAYSRMGDRDRSRELAAVAEAGQKELQGTDAAFFSLIHNPNRSPEDCYRLGHTLLFRQSRENGIFWLEAALRLDEGYVPAHRDMAEFYRRTGQSAMEQVHLRYLTKAGGQ